MSVIVVGLDGVCCWGCGGLVAWAFCGFGFGRCITIVIVCCKRAYNKLKNLTLIYNFRFVSDHALGLVVTMNKSEDERKADALEASCVEIQDCVPTLACGETSMIEDSFNSDCLGEEKGISDVGAKDYLQDVNSKMHFAEGIQFHEIVKAGEPGLRSLYDVENFLE